MAGSRSIPHSTICTPCLVCQCCCTSILFSSWLRALSRQFLSNTIILHILHCTGALLLRNSTGHVYYISSGSIQQVDLSNDELIGNMFGDGQVRHCAFSDC